MGYAERTFSDLLAFSRSGEARYLDEAGILQVAADGVPRYDAYRYVGGVLTGPSLRLESAAATNLLTYSEALDDASWTKVEGTVTADQTTAPDDATTADIFVPSTNNVSNHTVRKSVTVSAAKHTWSVFAKPAGYSWVWVLHADGDGTSHSAYFDVENGVVGTVSAGATAQIEKFGNGWYRCSVTPDAAASASSTQNQFVYVAEGDGDTLFAGDGTSGVYVWGAQLETGSIPTSYIPTSGATATRSAETLTIAAADMPDYQTVEYLSSTLVTNGTFDTDLSSWTTNPSGLFTQSGGRAVTNDADQVKRLISDDNTIEAGKVYQVTWDQFAGTNTGASNWTRLGVWDGGENLVTPYANGEGAKSRIIVAPVSGQFYLYNFEQGVEYDNVIVREITPLSVCFQMSGAINYVDEDVFEQERLFRWQVDGNNYIKVFLSTGGGTTGRPTFNQSESGTIDGASNNGVNYSPGINVPFNISSRHGSNFVNGAVDGTALTANTTPTAIPDLSTADFEVGPTFNGHIDQLLIWNEDIKDAGIAEVTLL